ncbi:membrane protein [Arthrobacter phage BruhMoment]|nr:membrane protein [Arthrobacter phage BruhMoment]
MADGKHEVGVGTPTPETVDPATITIDGVPLDGAPAYTVFNLVKYYGKAVIAALIAGLTYLLTVLAPTATAGDITLVQWLGFLVSTLGTFIGTAAVTNGAKPVK